MPNNPQIRELTSSSYIDGIKKLNSLSQIYNTRQTLNSRSYIEERKSTIVCDGQIVSDIIDEFGSSIILRVRTKSIVDSDDAYATATVTNTDYRKTALAIKYTQNDEEVREGTFKNGEVVFVFPVSDESYVKTGNHILYGGSWFEIYLVDKNPMQDSLYRLEARVRKI